MGTINTKQLFDQADELREQKVEVMNKQAANREILRNLAATELLTEDELTRLEEIYPYRTRERSAEEAGE
jgi:L-2-hydroxyglutarate oxidase LhgO